MFEEVFPDIFRIEVPLPNNPLKSLNSYLVKGKPRHLLIDTGFNRQECWQALTESLQQLSVHTNQLDIFVTHLHADHCGLATELATSDQATIWASASDGAFVNKIIKNDMRHWNSWFVETNAHGLDKELLEELKQTHPAIIYAPEHAIHFTPAQKGDALHYGNYTLDVLSTPGHTPDHLSLYIASEKILFSGDMILGDITPNIAHWPETKDSLGDYFKSLDELAQLDIACTLPGHRNIVHNTAARISELKTHHHARLQEVIEILATGAQTAAEVASQMHWSMRGMTWTEFPPPQKWFATNEALAHLDHLVTKKKSTVEKHNEKFYFSLN